MSDKVTESADAAFLRSVADYVERDESDEGVADAHNLRSIADRLDRASQQSVPNSVVDALTNDTSLQATMATEFKVRGIEIGIPTTALQACMVHVLEAAATLQQSGQTEAASAECFAGSVYDYTGPPLNPPRLQRQTEAELLREALRRQCDNMAFVLNRVDLKTWHDRFTGELAEDRTHLNATQGEDA